MVIAHSIGPEIKENQQPPTTPPPPHRGLFRVFDSVTSVDSYRNPLLCSKYNSDTK